MATGTEPPAHTNRLARESSPYLLQHAHNPVDWYPWGPEAFAAARKQNKPIFLSVGYSTCYWCHVMERQCFENESIAGEMNRRFINIKVDREERPDVDQLYMNAVHATVGQGGWPMSVFLTPHLKPFYAGTYFPPTDGHGRVGFPRLLGAIDEAWQRKPAAVEKSAEQIVEVLKRMAEPAGARGQVKIDRGFIEAALDQSASDYDPVEGGFGSAPKFPRQTLLELLLVSQESHPNAMRLNQVVHTLDAMARGGIRDHLGGAFHRYSTDDRWLVPHFEIMLYDNAMLAWVYTQAYALTSEVRHASVARGILDFILREMTSDQGAFYTAIDAEVDAREGLSYLWTAEEISNVLGADAEMFNRAYGVWQGPNFVDPHHGNGVAEKSILYLAEPANEEMDRKLAPMRQALYAKRRERKQPLLDTKVLTSWNALMIRALAHAGAVLKEPIYSAAAGRAADYLLRVHRTPGGDLRRMSRDGKAKGDGFLDDYAFFAQGLLSLGRRGEAKTIAERMCERFLDRHNGGFYFSAEGADDILVRQKTASDSPLPSGNAVAAAVMLELGEEKIARDAIARFGGQLQNFGAGMSALVQAALQYVQKFGPIDVEGPGSQKTPAEVVTLTGEWESADVLIVSVDIAAGFHINGPQTTEGLTATRLSVDGDLSGAVAGIDYPDAAMRTFPFADSAIPIYDGRVNIRVRFNKGTAGRSITVYVQCQPCDETSCLASVNKRLVVKR